MHIQTTNCFPLCCVGVQTGIVPACESFSLILGNEASGIAQSSGFFEPVDSGEE